MIQLRFAIIISHVKFIPCPRIDCYFVNVMVVNLVSLLLLFS